MTAVYSTIDNDEDEQLIPVHLKQRTTSKAIAKRERQANARIRTKKGTQSDERNRKDEDARLGRGSKERQLALTEALKKKDEHDTH